MPPAQRKQTPKMESENVINPDLTATLKVAEIMARARARGMKTAKPEPVDIQVERAKLLARPNPK